MCVLLFVVQVSHSFKKYGVSRVNELHMNYIVKYVTIFNRVHNSQIAFKWSEIKASFIDHSVLKRFEQNYDF